MLAIKMRGELEEFRVPANFQSFVNEMNMAGAQGRQYVLFVDDDDHPVAVNTHNILTVRELDDGTGLV